MAFSQLKYSEKKAEKEALFSLLSEYFDSRTNIKDGLPSRAEIGLSDNSQSKSVQPSASLKPKPPVPRASFPVAPKPSPVPPSRGPPPINRNTRPSKNLEAPPPPPQLAPPPPLETPPLWGKNIPRFEYPPTDHSSPGIDLFNEYIPYPINELHSSTIVIFGILYPDPDFKPKNVQSSVKLIMRDMDGVAHAANAMSYSGSFTGQSFPNVTHRSDFVFSTNYLKGLRSHSDAAFEIRGIILHELTHTFQYSAEGTPGGLIEGIADFVRLRGEHAAKHWTESPEGKKWDQGYETTAYFLDWVEKNVYEGLVAQINDWLGKTKTYDEQQMFDALMPGWSWDILWEQYLASR